MSQMSVALPICHPLPPNSSGSRLILATIAFTTLCESAESTSGAAPVGGRPYKQRVPVQPAEFALGRVIMPARLFKVIFNASYVHIGLRPSACQSAACGAALAPSCVSPLCPWWGERASAPTLCRCSTRTAASVAPTTT
eukprot:4241690-Pleurochrysis_carterae.AAC.1